MNSIILRTASRLLVGLLLMFSIFLLLRGHNEPGGGFIGGLVAAVAFILYGLAAEEVSVRQALHFDTRSYIATGLLIAGASALFPILLGLPFLSGVWGAFNLYGRTIELGTPVIFDLGVYIAVLGVALTIVLAM
ncbi:MAG TPA: Na+/H+ antiporter subunit B, partial [Roseiflexaceae bacterium]|nr:Na+/H+ antiporter subunit B [Roseiflexaceae bacterium]